MRPARALRAARLLVIAVVALSTASAAHAQSRRRPLHAPPRPEAAEASSVPVRPVSSGVVWSPVPGVVVAARDSAALAAMARAPAAESAGGTLVGTGRASYYGERFRGQRTASGERFDPDDLTAAHRTLPFGTRLRVTNVGNDRSVVVRVTDRGPFHRSRLIDVSKAAARALGMIGPGTARVRVERL